MEVTGVSSVPQAPIEPNFETVETVQQETEVSQSTDESKKPFERHTKIALMALGGVALAFLAYQAWSLGISINSSKCTYGHENREWAKTMAMRVKNASLTLCSKGNKELLKWLDKKIEKIDAKPTGICSFFSSRGFFSSSSCCEERWYAIGDVRDKFNSIYALPSYSSVERFRELDSSCMTEIGLVKKTCYSKFIGMTQSLERFERKYKRYLNDFYIAFPCKV